MLGRHCNCHASTLGNGAVLGFRCSFPLVPAYPPGPRRRPVWYSTALLQQPLHQRPCNLCDAATLPRLTCVKFCSTTSPSPRRSISSPRSMRSASHFCGTRRRAGGPAGGAGGWVGGCCSALPAISYRRCGISGQAVRRNFSLKRCPRLQPAKLHQLQGPPEGLDVGGPRVSQPNTCQLGHWWVVWWGVPVAGGLGGVLGSFAGLAAAGGAGTVLCWRPSALSGPLDSVDGLVKDRGGKVVGGLQTTVATWRLPHACRLACRQGRQRPERIQ